MKARNPIGRLLALILLPTLSPFASPGTAAVDFAKEIQPILMQRCLECHGPEKQKGKLRLDSKAEAFKEDYNIVPGKPDDSDMYARIILPKDDDDIMPAKGEPLDKQQIDLIKAWIAEGAQWPEGLVIKPPVDPNAEVDPRKPIQPSAAEVKAIAQLKELGVQVRPVAMNVTWTLANFRGVESNNVGKAIGLLKDVMTLEDLNLAGLPLQDSQLKSISGLVNLNRLHLEKTPVTDAGLSQLSKLENLKYLNLYKTQVTDEGLNHIKELKNLKNIYLWQSKVTEEGAKKLSAALPKAHVNMGWEMSALAKKIEEEKKKQAEEEAKKKAEEAKKKAEEEAKKKAEAEEEAKKKAEAEKAKAEAEKAKAKAEAKAEAEKAKAEEEAKKKAEAEKKDN